METTVSDVERTDGYARNAVTVLYVDPDSDRRGSVENALSSTYPVRTAATPADADTTLTGERNWVVVASDDCDSVEERIRDSWANWPVVFLTDTRDPERLRSVDRAGAIDIVFRFREDFHDTLLETIKRYDRRSSTDMGNTVLDIAGSLMSAAPDEVDTKIEWGLRTVGSRLGADACVLYDVADDLEPTHSWVETTDLDLTTTIETDSFPGYDSLSSFESYCVPSERSGPGDEEIMVDRIPQEFGAESDGFTGDSAKGTTRPSFLDERGLESFLAVPVVVDWELSGVLVVGRRTARGWPEPIRRQVKRFGELIGHTRRRERRRTELQRQNDRLERFASVVSHDIRNPINVIDGYTELAQETGDLSVLENVSTATDRMEAILNDLLTLARDGQRIGVLEPTDVGELARETWNGVDTNEASLLVSDPRTVEADRGRLRQVFENVFRNAIEHAGPEPTVRVAATDTGFAIEDDGPGIPAEMRETVFEEGYTDGAGTGLGLSIVETVIDAHGWSVTLTEGPDGGARFEIDIDP